MSLTRLTWTLGILAGFLLGFSIYFLVEQEKVRGPDLPGGVLLEGLAENITNVSQITLAGNEETTTLNHDGTSWKVAEKAGYPANGSFVQGLLSGLKQSERLDPKTNKPKYLERLGLGKSAVIITLMGEKSNILAVLTTGDQFLAPGGGGIITFAWDERDQRVWTVSSLPQISSNPAFWLRQEVIRLSTLRIKSVDIEVTGGPAWSVSKSSPEAQLFSLGASGPEQVNQPNARAIAYALAQILLLDVAQQDELELFRVASATYRTFDGLGVTLTFYEYEGEIWTTFEARYDENVLLGDETPPVMMDAPPDGAAEAESMNALWRGRAFLITVTKIAEILQSQETLRN